MKGNYFKKVFILVLANLIVKPLWIFGIEVAVQNRLGTEAYGHYGALFFLSVILQILLDLGLQTYNTQRVAQAHSKIKYLLPNIVAAKLLLAFVYLAALMLIGWQLGYALFSLKLLFLLGLTQIFNSFSMYYRSCITSLQQYNVDIYLSVLDKSLMIIITAILLFNPNILDFKVEWFIFAQMISYFISGIISMYLVLKYARLRKFKLQTNLIFKVIKKSYPIAILILLMALFMRGDLIILERLNINLDPKQAGQYTASYRFLDAANNFTGLLLAAWLLPLFGKHLTDRAYIQKLVSSALRILVPVAIVLVLYTLFYGEEVMQLFYTDYQVGEGYLLFLFMLGYPFYCFTYVYSTLNTAADKIKTISYFALIAFIYNVSANLIFVPHYGVFAVAVNSVITQAIFSILNTYYSITYFKLQTQLKLIVRLILFTLLIAGFIYLFKQSNLSLLYATILVAVTSVTGVFMFKIIRFGELKSYD